MGTITVNGNWSGSKGSTKSNWGIVSTDKSKEGFLPSEKLALRLSILVDDDLGGWSLIKAKLKQKFSNLTDDDLYFVEGKEGELIEKIINKIGDRKKELQELINTF